VTSAKLADTAIRVSKLVADDNLSMTRNWITDTHGMQYNTTQSDGLTLRTYGNADGIRLVTDNSVHMWIDADNNSDNDAVFQVHADQHCHCPGKRTIFTLDEKGNFSAAGAKSAVVETESFGQRKLYAAESPEVRFFDEGIAHLRDGVARAELESIFLETIEGDYLIQITPYGDASLYVSEIGADYFVVKAREGDPNVAFAWRLSATRKGYAGVRLEEVESTDLQN